MIFEFGECALDAARQELWRDGAPVHVEPQVLAVLQYLVDHRDRMVTKIELLDEVWGDRFVSESALTSRIKLARKACGDNGRAQRIVKTVHSRGYRFVADVTVRDDASTDTPPAPARGAREGELLERSSTLFGRDAELARLDAVLAEAAAGERRSVLVRGGVGMGKSTLVAEFLERQDDVDGWWVARGQGIHTRGGVEPYFCLFDALGRLARAHPDAVRDTLDRVAPSWLAQLPALLDPVDSGELERRLLGATPLRMLREGADAFEALAARHPLVLVLEDVQWADDCTLDVIELLLQRREPAPLLLVATERAEHDRPPAATGRQATVIELGPLDETALAALVADRLGGAALPADLATLVADRCGGVPLFAEEILSAWVREGLVTAADGSVEVHGSLDSLGATVPDTLPPLIERELTELDPESRTVLEACAVAGGSFDAATVAAGLGVPVTEAEVTLAALARQRSLIGATGATSWPDGTISATYAFTHGLYREVVYDRLPASARATLHARIGLALESGYGDRRGDVAVTLAGHFVQAGDTERAVDYLRSAGEQAAARNAHGHAAAFLAQALDQAAALPASATRDRAELLVRTSLGPALVATEGWFAPEVAANYERALALCADDPTCPEAAAARYGLATVSELRGQFARTEELLTPLLETGDSGHLALEAHELVACSTFHQGAFERSLSNASAVLDSWDEDAYSVLMARIAEHPASSCSSWSSLANWALGRSDESLHQAERAVALGERNLYALSTAVQQRAMLHQLRNEPEECIEWADRCRRVGEDQDFPMRTIQADIYKGWALGVLGAPDEGMELLREGLSRFHDAGATLNEAYYLGLHADACLHGGEPERALELLDEALERMRATARTYFFHAELHRLRARGLLALGGSDAVEAARGALGESQAIAELQGAPTLLVRTLCDRIELELGAADGDAAPWRQALAAALRRLDEDRPTPDAVRARSLLSGPDDA